MADLPAVKHMDTAELLDVAIAGEGVPISDGVHWRCARTGPSACGEDFFGSGTCSYCRKENEAG